MADAFKDSFNKKLIQNIAKHFQQQWAEFDSKAFVASASKNLASLELKERSEQIMQALNRHLPDDYVHAAKIVTASLGDYDNKDLLTADRDRSGIDSGISGWAIMPLCHYVGIHGYDHFDISMKLFKELTKRFTAEFGIRFFILRAPKKTLSHIKRWSKDPCKHVRRLASEGIRPRLPWAMQLPMFIKAPQPVLEI